LALGGLVVLAGSTTLNGPFQRSNGDQLVLWATYGVALGLAALALGTRRDQPESPAYVTFATIVAAALLGLLTDWIDNPSGLAPLLIGLAVVPLLVGGVVALAGLLRPLADGSGRVIALVTAAGLGVLIGARLIAVLIVGAAALFGPNVNV
jgi:hypothetical protein